MRKPFILTLGLLGCLSGPVAAQVPGRDRVLPPAPAPVAQPDRPANGRWFLGVRGIARDTGVSVRAVVPNSAAALAGLEPGDQIITVEGFQVGYVDGQLYDLGNECLRRADANGRVMLLIHRARGGQIVNLPVQLAVGEEPASYITGTVSIEGPVAARPRALIRVRLVETPGSEQRSVVVAEDTVNYPARGFPVGFRLAYDPSDLRPNRTYHLDAELWDQGQLLYRARAWTPIQPGAIPPQIDLRLEPVTGQAGSNREIVVQQIRTWYLRYFGVDPVQPVINVWLDRLRTGSTMEDVRVGILASDEFFQRAGSVPDRFVTQLIQVTTGQPLTPGQGDHWVRRFQTLGGNRADLVREYLRTMRPPF